RFLCTSAMQKPIFEQLKKGTSRIREIIMDSKQFVFIIILSMIVLGFLLSIVFSRLITGIYRDKPIVFLLIAIIALVFASFHYLDRIINLLFTKIIPSSFKEEVRKNKENNKNWEWNYFLYGNMVLASSFIPLTNYNSNTFSGNNSNSSGSCSSSCGSSCSSSCGSSCGGCGGD
ncbi:MAG TPA: hypothetical protein VF465_14560, partial [Flavobacterium sp.]|uniref:hypothetical protein n=1 Tax=Flavobacterium sp. TaxID=239 RepID=UPI002ED40F3D